MSRSRRPPRALHGRMTLRIIYGKMHHGLIEAGMSRYVRILGILATVGTGLGWTETRGAPAAVGSTAAPSRDRGSGILEAVPPQGIPRKTSMNRLPAGTRITLKPRKKEYFLGENILLDYRVCYEGDSLVEMHFGGDSDGYDYSRVLATDPVGKQVSAQLAIRRNPFHNLTY